MIPTIHLDGALQAGVPNGGDVEPNVINHHADQVGHFSGSAATMSSLPPTHVGVASIPLSESYWRDDGGAKLKEAVLAQAVSCVEKLIEDAGTSANPRLYPQLTTHFPFLVLSTLDKYVKDIYDPTPDDFEDPTLRSWEAALSENGLAKKNELLGHLLVDAIGERAVPYHAGLQKSVINLMTAATKNGAELKSNLSTWKHRKDTAEEIERKTANFHATRTTKIPTKFFEPAEPAPAPAGVPPRGSSSGPFCPAL